MLPDYMTAQELIIVDRVPDLADRVKELCETSVFAEQLKNVKITTLKLELTEVNYEDLLTPLFAKSDAVIDLTTV
jgi:hypothetical protein